MKNIAIWGTTRIAVACFKTLQKEYNIVCFIDNNKTKYDMKLLGLNIKSFEDAIKEYPDLEIYVCTTLLYKFSIMDSIIKKGFPKEKIINYRSYEIRKGCYSIESHIGVNDKHILFCTSSFKRLKSPQLNYAENAELTFRNFVNFKDEIYNATLQNVECHLCPQNAENFYPVDYKIEDVCVGFKNHCNFKCTYCCESLVDKSYLNSETKGSKIDLVLEFLDMLERENMVDPMCFMNIAPTEISIYPYKEKLINYFKKYVCFFISNCSIYDEGIADILKSSGLLATSLDCGTRETFKKVKQVDAFERVLENITKYSESGNVALKYIFLNDVNDNKNDVDGFVNICKTVRPAYVEITRDMFNFKTKLSDDQLNLIAYMTNTLKANDIFVTISAQVFSDEEFRYINNAISIGV
jgi:pyruvate-formate lyase-activating enzyme